MRSAMVVSVLVGVFAVGLSGCAAGRAGELATADLAGHRAVYYLPADLPWPAADAARELLSEWAIKVVRQPTNGETAAFAAYNAAVEAHLAATGSGEAITKLASLLADPAAVPMPTELRVITYNIRSFEGYTKNWDRCHEAREHRQMTDRFVHELRLYRPTVICLQEVPSAESVAELAAKLDMHYAHFPGGWKHPKSWPVGISGAVLSKYPILEAKSHPSLNWTERPEKLFTRFWGRALLDTPWGPIAVHGMHGYTRDSDVRLAELDEVLAVADVDLKAGRSVLILGDMNHHADGPEYRKFAAAGLTDSCASLPADEALTYSCLERQERIDFIWSGGPLAERLTSAEVLFKGAFRTIPGDAESFGLSDHLPVMAVFGK